MHECHLMSQMVKIVQCVVQDAGAQRAAVVRVTVSSLSHLSEEPSAMQTVFELAAQGGRCAGRRS